MPNALEISPDQIHIANRKIRELIRNDGRSQPKIADAAGVSQSVVSEIVNGKRLPNLSTLGKLAVALRLSFEEVGKIVALSANHVCRFHPESPADHSGICAICRARLDKMRKPE